MQACLYTIPASIPQDFFQQLIAKCTSDQLKHPFKANPPHHHSLCSAQVLLERMRFQKQLELEQILFNEQLQVKEQGHALDSEYNLALLNSLRTSEPLPMFSLLHLPYYLVTLLLESTAYLVPSVVTCIASYIYNSYNNMQIEALEEELAELEDSELE